MTEPTLKLRPAGPEDCRFYWEVNNAEATRALSISSDPIPWEDHQRWFASKLSEEQATLYVALLGEESIGVIRFEAAHDEALISVALAPNKQGKGLGRRLISLGTERTLKGEHIKRVVAYIRPANHGSIRAFEAAGYTYTKSESQGGIALLRYIAT